MIRILIADDHPLIRAGLKKLFRLVPDIKVQAEAERGEDVECLLGKNNIDLVVLDISFPGQSGLETLQQLKKKHPQLPVLMLSTHTEDRIVKQSFLDGASGYVMKNAAPEKLVSAIRKAIQDRQPDQPQPSR